MVAYATAEEYEAYIGDAPDGIGVLLARASRLVDDALLCAVYETDDNGDPVDPAIQAAIQAATIEQAAQWAATGEDGTGASAEYDSVTIGSVSLSRAASSGAGGGGSAATRLAPQARMILQQAGLLGGPGPRTC